MIGPGEYVYSQAPIAEIAQVDPLHVEVFLPTAIYPALTTGQLMTVRPAPPIGGSYEARIVVIDRVFDGALDRVMVALLDSKPPSPEEFERLRAMIDEAQRQCESADGAVTGSEAVPAREP